MKVELPKTISNVEKLSELKTKMVLSTISGNYREFKNASKEYASIAVNDLQASKNAKGPSVSNVPLFSSVGLKMMKVWFLNTLRIKTPEEKLLKKLSQKEKINDY